MDPSGRYTKQQPIKSSRRTLPQNQFFWQVAMQERFWQEQCIWWNDKLRKTRSVTDTHKDRDHLSFGIIPENIQNLQERHEDLPRESTRRLSEETCISRTSVLRILHDGLKLFPHKFISCRGKLIKIKLNEKHFVKISVKGFKMILACWIWTIWTMLTIVAFVAYLLHFPVSRYVATKRWIVLLSGTLFLPKSLLHCRFVRRTDLWQITPRWFLSAAV